MGNIRTFKHGGSIAIRDENARTRTTGGAGGGGGFDILALPWLKLWWGEDGPSAPGVGDPLTEWFSILDSSSEFPSLLPVDGSDAPTWVPEYPNLNGHAGVVFSADQALATAAFAEAIDSPVMLVVGGYFDQDPTETDDAYYGYSQGTGVAAVANEGQLGIIGNPGNVLSDPPLMMETGVRTLVFWYEGADSFVEIHHGAEHGYGATPDTGPVSWTDLFMGFMDSAAIAYIGFLPVEAVTSVSPLSVWTNEFYGDAP